MDAWCALWFWPADKADLLDGTAGEYAAHSMVADLDGLARVLDGVPLTDDPPAPSSDPEPSAIPAPTPTPRLVEATALFSFGPEQTSFEDLELTADDDAIVEVKQVGSKSGKKTAAPKSKMPEKRQTVPLQDLDDWLEFLEAMLGTADVPEGTLIDSFANLDALKSFEETLPGFMGMDVGNPEDRFPWLQEVHDVAEEQGFLHWELEFAIIFARSGGFDLQVGNPPWVRPRWNESAVLAEREPWFELEDKASTADKDRRRRELLESQESHRYVLRELTNTIAQVAVFGSPQMYPLLTGTQPDLYRAFMCQVWAHMSKAGTTGMLHPDTHFTGDKEGSLREAAYRRLRIHGDFVNAVWRFFPKPVGHTTHFGIHVYGQPQKINFDHLSWLVSSDALRYSSQHDGTGDVPGVRYRNGEFDERPHKSRVVRVDTQLLAVWQRLLGGADQPVEQAQLLFPVSMAEASAIEALANYPLRLGSLTPQISSGYHESGAKKDNLIDYNRPDLTTGKEQHPDRWRHVILKGTQLSVATPVFKSHNASSNDPYGADLVALPSDFVPGTEYVRAKGRSQAYLVAQDRWIDYQALDKLRGDDKALARARAAAALLDGVPEGQADPLKVDALLRQRAKRRYSTFHRFAWRKMIAPDTERALYTAIIPPGATHIDGVRSGWVSNNRNTALLAGFWAALPIDYALRILGIANLDIAQAQRLPAPAIEHPLASALLLRTLRLNCLTRAYASLWAELYDPTWPACEPWACDWPGLQPLHDAAPEWHPETPLRSERARRSALVEIDALVAVWLGMDADALIAAYRGRFPVLQKYEAVTWFDAEGWKIAGNPRTIGQRQTKESWAQFDRLVRVALVHGRELLARHLPARPVRVLLAADR
ncbi:hypothetical protein AB0B44_34185, partial [Streptomyces sp. NPDC041003]